MRSNARICSNTSRWDWRALGGWFLAAVVVLGSAQAADAQHHFTTPADTIPNFAASPSIVSAAAGSWSSPATWSPARVPVAGDTVLIRHDVTYDSLTGVADVIGIDANGRLRFATNRDTRLKVGVLMVLPNGTLEIGTPAQPVDADSVAEIVIANRPLNGSTDPNQWGTGLISMDGKVTMHGAPKSPAFVRVSAEPLAGQTTIQFSTPVSGWRAGDQVFVPDSRQPTESEKFNSSYQLQVDRVTVQSVAADGRSITVSPLAYNHRGARDANGTPTVLSDGTKLLPHVGNLSRNVIIRSENPSGTRGHTAYTHFSDVHLAYVQFQDLGRTKAETINTTTNLKGRYPIHIHHLWGPPNPSNTGYQFEVIGNAVNDSLKWPLAVHGSHFGLIRNNVIFGGSQLTGAGISLEDGSETENLFDSNFVAMVRGNVNPRESGSDTSTPGSGGECYWTAGFNNRFVNNVASDCRNAFQQVASGPGFKMFTPPAPFTTQNPRFRGADMSNSAQTVSVVPQMQPILEFRGNEVYGGTASGLTVWHLGTDGYNKPTMAETVVRDFRVWNVHESALWNYPINKMTVENLEHRVDATQNPQPAIQSDDYRVIDLTVRGGNVHAQSVFGNADAPMGTIRIENVRAVTRGHAFNFITPGTPGTQAGIPSTPGITVVLKNNQVTAWPGRSLQTVSTDYYVDSYRYPQVKYEIYVQDYQGQAGNNFRVYWREQATQNIAGGLAPCNDTSKSEIDGITCAGGTAPGGGGGTPVACVVSSWGSWAPTTSWSACSNGTQSRQEQRTRTVVTPASNGGTACPALTETRTVTQACSASQPVACVVSSWSAWQPTGSWSACSTSGTQTRPEQRTRTVVTPASNGGTACPALTETRTATQSCTPAPTPIACVVSSWSAWQPTGPWSACTNNQQSRTETRTRSIVTAPQNGGTACPSLTESRTVTQSCTSQPPPTPEICGDGIDNDKDGQVDENCTPGKTKKPGAPRKLWRTSSGSTVRLGWDAPITGGKVTGYVVDVGFASLQTEYTFPVGMNRRLEVPNVGPGRYYVRVRAVNAAGSSPVSNQVVASIGCTTRSGQPSALVQSTAGSRVTFTWEDPDGCADTKYRLTAGSEPGLANLAMIDSDVASMTATAPPGTYYVRVQTTSAFGESAPSNEVAVNIKSYDCAPPTFPTGLDVELAGRQVNLLWSPADEAAAEASDDVSPISWVLEAGTASGLSNIGVFPMERLNAFSTEVPPGTYFVRVRPANACGAGPASNEFRIQVQ